MRRNQKHWTKSKTLDEIKNIGRKPPHRTNQKNKGRNQKKKGRNQKNTGRKPPHKTKPKRYDESENKGRNQIHRPTIPPSERKTMTHWLPFLPSLSIAPTHYRTNNFEIRMIVWKKRHAKGRGRKK